MTSTAEILPPKARACRDCPWRYRRSGRLATGRHPALLYSTHEAVRAELWDAIRGGVPWLCHRDEPGPRGRRAFYCSGATVLVTRELELLEREFGDDWDAYHREHPDGLTSKGAEYWRRQHRRHSAAFAKVELNQHVDRDQGAPPTPSGPDVEVDPVSGVRRLRLHADPDEWGYGMARTDDCLRPAIATLLQVPPNEMPDLHLVDRWYDGEDLAVIERESWATVEAWLLERDLQLTFHDTVPDRERWIGVCAPAPVFRMPFTRHCVVMSYGGILFDPATTLTAPPGKRAMRWTPSAVDYGITIDPKE